MIHPALAILGLGFVLGAEGTNLEVGRIRTNDHGVNGTVYITGDTTLMVKEFSYDGEGGEAFFYVGVDRHKPSNNGIQLEYPPGIDSPLNKSINVNLNLTLPKRLTYSDIKYLSVWNPKLEADFGHVEFHKYYTAGQPEVRAKSLILVLVSAALATFSFI